MEKRWVMVAADEDEVESLHKALNINKIFCQLLVQRGIKTFEQAKEFFRPELENLHNPFLMTDMEKAVERLEKAVDDKERIMIYGDYDVDGTTAVTLMFSFLFPFHKNIMHYIPDRYKEGYGISRDGIDKAIEQDVKLIIALDCGIKEVEQVRYAKDNNIDFIICDHHLPAQEMPEALAILNPKRLDCSYPFKELSGCGIGFKFAQAYAYRNGIPFQTIEPLLDLVVVSIACDLVPIVGENRILAYYGLKRLNESPRMGLMSIINLTGLTFPMGISDIVFGVGPMINAAGRISNAEEAVRLLLVNDRNVASQYAHHLRDKNNERRHHERGITEEAIEIVEKDETILNKKAIILYKKHWHIGVIGIVASRMVEKYHRPTLILTQSDGKIVGSARSVRGFDIHQAINDCADLLINFGGHQYAAGISLMPENIEAFKERFENLVTKTLTKEQEQPEQRIDAEIELNAITPKFWNVLKQFAPFGPMNMRPVFVSRSVQDTGYTKMLKDNHVSISIQQGESFTFSGIAFNAAEHYRNIKDKFIFDICYALEESYWHGKRSIKLSVKDFKFIE